MEPEENLHIVMGSVGEPKFNQKKTGLSTLFRNNRFMLNLMLLEKCSKSLRLTGQKNPKSGFRITFKPNPSLPGHDDGTMNCPLGDNVKGQLSLSTQIS